MTADYEQLGATTAEPWRVSNFQLHLSLRVSTLRGLGAYCNVFSMAVSAAGRRALP
jgi:hypothetical protein